VPDANSHFEFCSFVQGSISLRLVSIWYLFPGSTGKHERDIRDYGDFA
jgi:hypothetical protein